MARLSFAIFGVFLLSLAPISSANGMSLGLADTFYPSYGQARHFSQAFERLGTYGTAYDGVNLTSVVAPGASLDLAVTTFVARSGGEYEWLGVWVDWNLDRQWDLSERAVYLTDWWFEGGATTHQWQIAVPAGAAAGETWLRVRYTFDGPIAPDGDLYTGEVEDYRITVRPGGTPPVPEPAGWELLFVGLAGLLLPRFRHRTRAE